MTPRLDSVNLGTVQDYRDAEGRAWRSAIAKRPVEGPVQLSFLGPIDDEVGDRRHHGGPDQAVMVGSCAHRPFWRERLGLDIPMGLLGENLGIEGLDETELCIGDRFRVGGAELQVSQPRQPCATLARYWNCPELLPLIWETARSGWYFRVLAEGAVQAGDALQLLARPHPDWNVARVLRALHAGKSQPGECRAAAGIEALSPRWRERFQALADSAS